MPQIASAIQTMRTHLCPAESTSSSSGSSSSSIQAPDSTCAPSTEVQDISNAIFLDRNRRQFEASKCVVVGTKQCAYAAAVSGSIESDLIPLSESEGQLAFVLIIGCEPPSSASVPGSNDDSME